ncbi:hypothetical protein KUV85_14220 [Nocardioides panacisoli]|uniref:hypothetical protein n=1 Tax=Nocardioides panacisoli TaxID=627624 RepID=UPI001C62FDD0|nr:hypothetical protein [Nocardioides panacisoli]QYJ03473.1 hypothetical protein KUV85_14220 [Nocardioides panacisoli]
MTCDRLWERLLEALDAWGSAAQVGPGRIEVTLPDRDSDGRDVVIVMTPDEWVDMASVALGGFDSALEEVTQTLLELRPDEHYAVHREYRLYGATTPSLPDEEYQAEPGGEWVVRDDQGRIRSRLSDWIEPE